jgi:hypothetical protein
MNFSKKPYSRLLPEIRIITPPLKKGDRAVLAFGFNDGHANSPFIPLFQWGKNGVSLGKARP